MMAPESLSGSMTIVGDIAQATGTWVPFLAWAQVVEHLPARRGWRLVDLTVNYRHLGRSLRRMAGRVLESVRAGDAPAESVRSSGSPPRILAAAPGSGFGGEGLANLAAKSVLEERSERWHPRPVARWGSSSLQASPKVWDRLCRPPATFGHAGRGALDQTITLLSVDDAKGLEFDSVTVVEPGQSWRRPLRVSGALYVGSSPVPLRGSSSSISEALPAPLTAAAQHSA